MSSAAPRTVIVTGAAKRLGRQIALALAAGGWRVVVQSTRRVTVDDPAFDAARQALGSDRALFELLAVTAAYNMVSRLLVAFGVEPEV